jgi:hypothetical protein
VGFLGNDPNLYRYVKGRPMLLTDPHGTDPNSAGLDIAGAAFALIATYGGYYAAGASAADAAVVAVAAGAAGAGVAAVVVPAVVVAAAVAGVAVALDKAVDSDPASFANYADQLYHRLFGPRCP